eukprot:1622535-Pyramimonas_sp.AAC.1
MAFRGPRILTTHPQFAFWQHCRGSGGKLHVEVEGNRVRKEGFAERRLEDGAPKGRAMGTER